MREDNENILEIQLITIGKTQSKWLREGIGLYLERLRRYLPFSISELPDARRARTPAEQKREEGRLLLAQVAPSDRLVLLDERGRGLTSEAFAGMLQKNMASGLKRLVFAIGGPYGFAQEVYDRADSMLSLSHMTFTHEMARLFFIEQLYRGAAILRGDPYHHA